MWFIEGIVPIIVALVGSAGLWGFVSLRAKQSFERLQKNDEKSGEFNRVLREQVDLLNAKVDSLLEEKEMLMNALADLREELAAARATINHLEGIVKFRRDLTQPR